VRVRAEIKTWATCVQGSEQPGACREDHATKGVKQCTMVLGGARWSMITVEAFGWVRLVSLTDTEDGEDRRQRRRSVRADAVRILWRGNTWRMPKGCMLRHAMARG
jgi:hypothetical protein